MFKFLSYGIGGVLGGAISAIFICAILLILSARQSKYRTPTLLAILSGLVLFFTLFYQLTNLYCAIQCKYVVLNTIDGIRQGLQNFELQSGKEFINGVIDTYPIINVFFDTSLINDIDWSDPIKSLNNIVRGQFNGFIYGRIAWSLIFTIILGALMFLPNNIGIGRKRKGYRDASELDCHYGEDFY